MLWNQFLNERRLTESIPSFKKLIRKWLGLYMMYIIFIVVNLYLFYYYHYYYCYCLLLLPLSLLLYIPVVKSSNGGSNRETYCPGYYVDKNTHKKCYFSNL